MLIDFNLASAGETTNALAILIQEIESIMTAEHLTIITDITLNVNFDQYLFKHNVTSANVANKIRAAIRNKLTNPEGFEVKVTCRFVDTSHTRDMLVVDFEITGTNNTQQNLQYIVAANAA